MVNNVWGLHSQLGANITSKDTEIKLRAGSGIQFKAADDGHFYVTLRNKNVREVVKVVGRTGDTLTVERGHDGTTPQTFSTGACVDVEWNPSQLCEFVTQCVTGDSNKIKPQTVCVQCGTCLTLDAGGHVVEVNGVKGC